MLRDHQGPDAAADEEVALDAYPLGLGGLHQVIEDLVGDGFVEGALVAEAPEVELERLGFHAELVGLVEDPQLREIRLARERTKAGELFGLEGDGEGAPRPRAHKSVELSRGARHHELGEWVGERGLGDFPGGHVPSSRRGGVGPPRLAVITKNLPSPWAGDALRGRAPWASIPPAGGDADHRPSRCRSSLM